MDNMENCLLLSTINTVLNLLSSEFRDSICLLHMYIIKYQLPMLALVIKGCMWKPNFWV